MHPNTNINNGFTPNNQQIMTNPHQLMPGQYQYVPTNTQYSNPIFVEGINAQPANQMVMIQQQGHNIQANTQPQIPVFMHPSNLMTTMQQPIYYPNYNPNLKSYFKTFDFIWRTIFTVN